MGAGRVHHLAYRSPAVGRAGRVHQLAYHAPAPVRAGRVHHLAFHANTEPGYRYCWDGTSLRPVTRYICTSLAGPTFMEIG